MFVLALGFTRAPMQCASRRHPDLAHEETPGQALWNLAEQFGADGDAPARERTLRFLLARYPTSHYAERARDALGSSGSTAATDSPRGDGGGR